MTATADARYFCDHLCDHPASSLRARIESRRGSDDKLIWHFGNWTMYKNAETKKSLYRLWYWSSSASFCERHAKKTACESLWKCLADVTWAWPCTYRYRCDVMIAAACEVRASACALLATQRSQLYLSREWRDAILHVAFEMPKWDLPRCGSGCGRWQRKSPYIAIRLRCCPPIAHVSVLDDMDFLWPTVLRIHRKPLYFAEVLSFFERCPRKPNRTPLNFATSSAVSQIWKWTSKIASTLPLKRGAEKLPIFCRWFCPLFPGSHDLVNFGTHKDWAYAYFFTRRVQISHFRDCRRVYTEVTKQNWTKFWYVFGSDKDLKMYVKMWGSLP